MIFGMLAPLTLAALALVATLNGSATPPVVYSNIRIVDVRGAAALVSRGASVLDARTSSAYAAGHLPGAQLYVWSMMMVPGPGRGRLREDFQGVAHTLATLGVDESRPTLVYGSSMAGNGEEGHAAWLLALLGHAEIAMLDGGLDAWRAAGRPVVTSVTSPRVGKFTARVQAGMLANRASLDGSTPVQLVDVRTSTEFKAQGRIAGATNVDWRLVMDEQGRVRSAARLHGLLSEHGINAAQKMVLVCSNSVRSTFVSAVFSGRGLVNAAVFDGGMNEWSADPSAPIERG